MNPRREVEIVDGDARDALQEALQRYPRFAALQPRLVEVPLRQGSTLLVKYAQEPARDDADAWEFQNAVVKGYRARITSRNP